MADQEPKMPDLELVSIDEMFRLLESNRKHVVQEIQRLIHEKFSESRDSGWLITGLYDYYASTQSVNGLKLLLNVKEPMELVLCDRIYEGLKGSDEQARTTAVNMLGFIARKQPTWIHKITQSPCFKELLKILKHDTDVVILVTGLLVLLSLLPAVPAKVSPWLNELFDIFSRISGFLHSQRSKEIFTMHLHVALYAFFNRLYGMFPCNFLSWLRQHYSNSGKDQGVFADVIAPLLSTVRMHPLLVTHSKEHEKSAARWKGLGEVHDVLAECSRYSLDIQEAGSREDPVISSFLDLPLTPGLGVGVGNLDSSWTPGKFFEPSPSVTTSGEKKKSANLSVRYIDSPPEAAIEATPENTPFATPVKEEGLRLQRRPPSSHAVRNLMKSPGPQSPTKNNPLSPSKDGKEGSPFRFPTEEERRDSLFSEIPSSALNKRDSLGLSRPDFIIGVGKKSLTSDRPDTIIRTNEDSEHKLSDAGLDSIRPLPIKFNKEAQQQQQRPLTEKLFSSLQQEDIDEDTEVSSLTKSGERRSLDTRHITPHIFSESASRSTPMTPATPSSRAQSRLSTGGANTPGGDGGDYRMASPSQPASFVDTPTPFASIAPVAKHPKSRERSVAAVDDFVTSVRKRVRYITLCEPEEADEEEESIKEMARSTSCPDLNSVFFNSTPEVKPRSPVKYLTSPSGEKIRLHSGTQTEDGQMPLPWEHLFPASLPLPLQQPQQLEELHPEQVLDKYIQSAIKTLDKSGNSSTLLRDEVALLHSQLLFERHRREVLGARNRRLLGKTKSFRDLEEENVALNDQLQMAQSEINTLHVQLSSLRSEKHKAETHWSAAVKQQEEKYLTLQREQENLKLVQEDTQSSLKELQEKELSLRTDAENSKADLFQAKAKLENYKGKETKWERSEVELDKLKKQILLQAELIRAYRDKLDEIPAKPSQRQVAMITEAAEHEVAAARTDLASKSSELTVAQGTIADLETKVGVLEKSVEEQKVYLVHTQEEGVANLRAANDNQTALRSINSHLEMTVLELQERLERQLNLTRRVKKAGSISSDSLDVGAGGGGSGLQYVQSTGSSIQGSVGSDPGEHIRRAIEDTNPFHIERQIGQHQQLTQSPEIGSAHSANQDLIGVTSQQTSGSANGHGKY